ncbi:unnamed protein product [Nesidiocoris tenuis]|uniref:Uncharacterized protein n=1 Tax=Nesidiocoris tenuis TaxID=355587 RepID=A0A6H5H9G3_9HEMI|nr:unnamed protein product [Nesidiocoris tenuis]
MPEQNRRPGQLDREISEWGRSRMNAQECFRNETINRRLPTSDPQECGDTESSPIPGEIRRPNDPECARIHASTVRNTEWRASMYSKLEVCDRNSYQQYRTKSVLSTPQKREISRNRQGRLIGGFTIFVTYTMKTNESHTYTILRERRAKRKPPSPTDASRSLVRP